MGVIRNFFLNINAFQNRQFFRFDKEAKYTNLLGGFCTVVILMIIVTMLTLKFKAVFSYSNVHATSTINYQLKEVNSTISASSTISPFLVVYQVTKGASSLSDSAFKSNIVVWSINSSNIYTILQECTSEHWAASPQMYKQLLETVEPTSILYCLPPTFTHQISISQKTTFSIDFAFYCRADCSTVNNTQIFIRPIVLNRLINAQNNEEYLSQFLHNRLHYSFNTQTSTVDTVLRYQLAKYQIKTDNSVMPYQSESTENGFIFPSEPEVSSFPNAYPTIAFFRSLYSLKNEEYIYHRSYDKLIDAVAQIGGLIPVLFILFVWLNHYALYQFEMIFLKRLHTDQKAKQYSLFYFITTLIYNALQSVGFEPYSWESTRVFFQMHKIVNQMLDILYLYRRLEFIERALSVLFEDHQLQALHLMRNKTFQEAKVNLNRYQMKDSISEFIKWNKQHLEKQKDTANTKFGNEIILKPYVPESNNVLPQPLETDKNLMSCKQFEGQVKQSWNPPKQIQNEQTDKISHIQQIKDPQNRGQNRQERPIEDEEQYIEQITELRYAFASFERIRQEAAGQKQDYFTQVSRKILRKLDATDWNLLQDLEKILDYEDKEQIVGCVMDFLIGKNDEKQNELFKKSKEQLKKDLCEQEGQDQNLRVTKAKYKTELNIFLPSIFESIREKGRASEDKKSYQYPEKPPRLPHRRQTL